MCNFLPHFPEGRVIPHPVHLSEFRTHPTTLTRCNKRFNTFNNNTNVAKVGVDLLPPAAVGVECIAHRHPALFHPDCWLAFKTHRNVSSAVTRRHTGTGCYLRKGSRASLAPHRLIPSGKQNSHSLKCFQFEVVYF